MLFSRFKDAFTSLSICQKPSTPYSVISSCNNLPCLSWITRSESTKRLPRRFARTTPTVLFPEPGMPIRVILFFISFCPPYLYTRKSPPVSDDLPSYCLFIVTLQLSFTTLCLPLLLNRYVFLLHYTSAMTSTSHNTFLGRVLTATQLLAGFSVKYFA